MFEEKNNNEIPWEDFDMGTAEEENAKTAFKLIAPNLCVAECFDVKMTLAKKWQSEETEPQITWSFKLLKTVDGSPLTDVDGNPLEKDIVPVWSKLWQVKVVKGKPQLTRAILTALYGIPVNSALNKEMIKPENLIGRKCKLLVEIGEKKDGTPKQLIEKFMPLTATQPIQTPAQPQTEKITSDLVPTDTVNA